MAAISLIGRETGLDRIVRNRHRHRNWASANPGVILVFCIVFIVAACIICLFGYRKWMARKAEKQSMAG